MRASCEMVLYVGPVISCDAQAHGRSAGCSNARGREVTVAFWDLMALERRAIEVDEFIAARQNGDRGSAVDRDQRVTGRSQYSDLSRTDAGAGG